jgi:hypothetical protein
VVPLKLLISFAEYRKRLLGSNAIEDGLTVLGKT